MKGLNTDLFINGAITGSWITPITQTARDYIGCSRVTLYYKDGTQHTFKKVENIWVEKDQYGNRTTFVKGQRHITNQIESDITESGTLSYTVTIPAHYVKGYTVYSHNQLGKEVREVTL